MKDQQQQLDCEGFPFEGKPRHAEFIFADDALEMVWILTGQDEETALRRKMTAAYGAPDRENEKFAAFTKARAALRLDVDEVLFYSPRLDAPIAGWFATPSTFR